MLTASSAFTASPFAMIAVLVSENYRFVMLSNVPNRWIISPAIFTAARAPLRAQVLADPDRHSRHTATALKLDRKPFLL